MPSSTSPNQNTSNPTKTYSPSVPLSVYRELAAELQASQAMLESLNVQNQHLTQQNQQLRQEIDKAVQSVLRIKHSSNVDPTSPPSVTVTNPVLFQPQEVESAFRGKVFTHEQERYHRGNQAERASEVNGWLLAIAIFLIMATAFGFGYLIVRPVLQSR